MPSMHSKYTTNTMSSTVERSIDVSLSFFLALGESACACVAGLLLLAPPLRPAVALLIRVDAFACLFSTVPLFHNVNHYKSEYIAG